MCAGREKIADASGKSVVVEYIGSEMNVVYPGAEGYQAATNFLLTPGDYDFGKGQTAIRPSWSSSPQARTCSRA